MCFSNVCLFHAMHNLALFCVMLKNSICMFFGFVPLGMSKMRSQIYSGKVSPGSSFGTLSKPLQYPIYIHLIWFGIPSPCLHDKTMQFNKAVKFTGL